MPRFLSHLLFLSFTLMLLLPLRVQAALPKELPATPAKFLTGACLTRSEDLWITAEAGGVYRLSGQEMKPKWEDMRKQPGAAKKKRVSSLIFSQKSCISMKGSYIILKDSYNYTILSVFLLFYFVL